jgi:hypothetical protein
LVTASRIGELQVGAGYAGGQSDYANYRIKGPMFYADYDIKPHYGVEVDFRQLNQSSNSLYERTYEVGGRYLTRKFGVMSPYGKGMYGRGVLNSPNNQQAYSFNIAYNLFAVGGGADFSVRSWLNVRADAEYQYWLSGPALPRGLTPIVVSLGAAYRFGSYKLNGRQWILAGAKPEKAGKAPKNSPAPGQAQPVPPPVSPDPTPAPADSQTVPPKG